MRRTSARLAVALAFVALIAAIAGGVRAPARAFGMTIVPAAGDVPALPVYVAIPHGRGPFPAVVVLHGCEGFNAFYALTADKLAAAGYVGVAIDSVGPNAPMGACGDRQGSDVEARDATRVLAWLRVQPEVVPTRLGLEGYSMGGIATLALISSADRVAIAGVRAAVAYYPACDRVTADLAVPLAIFDGSADEIAPAPPCAALAQRENARGKAVEITTYPGATHGFVIPGDRTFFGMPIRFDRAATDAAEAATKTFFAKYL